jgi:transcriptional regulator with XRE-family HTH domain
MTLRELRLAKGISQEELAQAVSMHLDQEHTKKDIQNWEWRGVLRYELAEALALSLGVEFSEMKTILQTTRNTGVGVLLKRGRKKLKESFSA